MAGSNFLALRLFFSAFLVKVTNGIVPASYTPTAWDNAYCNQENKEVQDGCIGPGTCRKPWGWTSKGHWELDGRFYVECELIEQPANYTGPRTARANKVACPGTPDAAEFSWFTKTCGPWGEPGTPSWKSQFLWEQSSRMCPYPDGCAYGIATRNDILGIPYETTERVSNWATQTFCNQNPEVIAGCRMKGGCTYRHPLACNAYFQCVMDSHLGENVTTASALPLICPQQDESNHNLEWSDATKKCEPKGSPGTCSGTADIPTLPAGKMLFTSFCGSMLGWERNAYKRPESPFVDINGDCVAYLECFPDPIGIGIVLHCSPGQMFNKYTKQCEAANANGTCNQRHPSTKLAFGIDKLAFYDAKHISAKPLLRTKPLLLTRSAAGGTQAGIDSEVFPKASLVDCFSYIESWEGPSEAKFLSEIVRCCLQGEMFNHYARVCGPANANGTCDQIHLKTWRTLHNRDSISAPGNIDPDEYVKNVLDQLIPGTPCTTQDFESTGCKGPQDCVYHEGSCYSYLKCTPNADGNVTADRMWCPKRQEYSISKRMCLPAGSEGTCSDKNYLQHSQDWNLCSTIATRAVKCGKSTNCTYPIPSIEGGCRSYVQCTEKPGDNRTGTAGVVTCDESGEYSNITQRCEPAGSPGTCSSKEREKALSERTWPPTYPSTWPSELTKIATKLDGTYPKRGNWAWGTDKEYELLCSKDALRKAGCKNSADCSYFYWNPNLGVVNCDGFVQCTRNPDPRFRQFGKPVISDCGIGREFSNQTLKCERAGSPGTCSEKKTNRKASVSFDCCGLRRNGTCVWMKAGKHGNPKDCNSYIECIADPASAPGSEEGLPVIKQCPPGKGEQRSWEWNNIEGKCDWAGAPGTCSGTTRLSYYGITCPKWPPSFQDIANLIELRDPFTWYFNNLAGMCNAVVNCFPQDSDTIPRLMFCQPGMSWNRQRRQCEPVVSPSHQQDTKSEVLRDKIFKCEALRDKNFKCPEETSERNDCKHFNFDGNEGFRCISAKGPEWYIACMRYEEGSNQTKPFEMRCPYNSVYDHDAGYCKFPNAPNGYKKEEFVNNGFRYKW